MTGADVAPAYFDAEAYERFNGRWSRISGRSFIAWLTVPTNSRWLDVGCGTGALCEVIIERCAPSEYVVIDIADAQLSYASARHQDDRVHFRRDDALALTFDDQTFDAAVSAYVINFFPEPRQMASEMRRVVRPSGVVAACTWDFAGNRAVAQHIGAAIAKCNPAMIRRAATALHADSTRREAMEGIFRDVGLRDVSSMFIDTPVIFRDFEDYWTSNADFSSSFNNDQRADLRRPSQI